MKLIFTTHMILTPALILNTVCIQGMKSNLQRPLNAKSIYFLAKKIQKIEQSHAPKEYEQCALHAAAHNQTNPLLLLPNELLIHIFSYCQTEDYVKSLEYDIKNFMKLSASCKGLNKILTFDKIGQLCKDYAPIDKTETLKQLIKITTSLNYRVKRLPALILVCAGADINSDIYHYHFENQQHFWFQKNPSESDFLLQKAVAKNDIQMITTLFKHHASADLMLDDGLGPLFFHVKTKEIAQLFINQGVNARITEYNNFNPKPVSGLHAIHISEHNFKIKILKQIIEDTCPSEILALYFEHNNDAAQLNFQDNSCLLHLFAKPFTMHVDNIDNFITKGKLILNAMPDMINTLNHDNQTPLDIAHASLTESQEYGTPEAFETLIALFREYGGKIAKELAQEAYPNCIICLDKQEDIVELPCINNHDKSYTCLNCYSKLLEIDDDDCRCPLCREPLKT